MINIAQPVIEQEEIDAVVQVMKSGSIAHGKVVEQFEDEFAKYIGTKYAVAVNSGTSALCLALRAIGIGDNHYDIDTVITTPFSFIATANSILYNNGLPRFADINQDTFNIDENEIEQLIRMNVKAIMPVHLYGQACNMTKIMEIANEHGIYVVEDCAQAHGAEWCGKKVGSFGIGCFSFYPTKNMCGSEGGIITTNDEDIYNKLLALRNHGQVKRYYSDMLGYNNRMTNIVAAICLEQLKKLDKFNTQRQYNARVLNNGLKDIKGIQIPYVDENCKHVYNQYTIKVDFDEFGMSRDELANRLFEKGISTGIYYPILMPFQKHIQKGINYLYMNANNVTDKVLSLPVHPSLKNDSSQYNDLKYIIDTIKEIKCTL